MKKILIIVLSLSLLAMVTGCVSNKPTEQIKQEIETPPEVEEVIEDEIPKEAIPSREEAIGKSDKDFMELTKSKPNAVRNDVTDKWRKVSFAESVDINEYILSYSDLYMGEDTTVHAVINFTYNTTSMINDFGDHLYVTTREYVSKEEHDAKKLGNGMVLGEYQIYKDNGDIIEIK